MDIRGLQAGDFVLYKGTNDNYDYFKVTEVIRDLMIVVMKDGVRYYAGSDDIRPIRLTEGILMKNGFMLDNSSCFSQEIGGYHFTINLDSCEIVCTRASKNAIVLQLELRHVHELQNILRIVGLYDEANNLYYCE